MEDPDYDVPIAMLRRKKKKRKRTSIYDEKSTRPTRGAIKKLVRKGGVKRINGLVYEEVRSIQKDFLRRVLKDATTYTQHAGRKTISANDVVSALKRQGRTLYGYGD